MGRQGLGMFPLSLLSSYLLQKSKWERHEGPEGTGSSTVTQVLSEIPLTACVWLGDRSWTSLNSWRLSLKAFVHHGYGKANPVLCKLKCGWDSKSLVQMRPDPLSTLWVIGECSPEGSSFFSSVLVGTSGNSIN